MWYLTESCTQTVSFGLLVSFAFALSKHCCCWLGKLTHANPSFLISHNTNGSNTVCTYMTHTCVHTAEWSVCGRKVSILICTECMPWHNIIILCQLRKFPWSVLVQYEHVSVSEYIVEHWEAWLPAHEVQVCMQRPAFQQGFSQRDTEGTWLTLLY